MQFADGEIIGEEKIENEFMSRWAESYRCMNDFCSNRFGDYVAEELHQEYAFSQVYTIRLDSSQSVQVPQSNQCMRNAKIGDRIRIGSKTGDFEKGTRKYYNLSRGPPPMDPLKMYLNQVHKGSDGCDYEVRHEVTPGKKQGKYLWRVVAPRQQGPAHAVGRGHDHQPACS